MLNKAFAKLLLAPLLILLMSCEEAAPPPDQLTEVIRGRTQNSDPLYRIKTLPGFIRQDPSHELIEDTMTPLCSFFFSENDEEIKVTIHNFPTQSLSSRIPPEAQVARWKKQFSQLDFEEETPQAFSGFVGRYFEGSGIFESENQTMLAWSLQLAPEHYPHSGQDVRSDVTIKIVGSKALVEKYREDLVHFARSFELIEDIEM